MSIFFHSTTNSFSTHLKIILAVIICCHSFILLSQKYSSFGFLSTTDGLSQSTINCIHQDKEGLLWIGTQDGLNVYDGLSFTYFQNQPGDTTSISDNYILSICEDQNENIWLGTMSGGLNRFCKKTQTTTRYLNRPNEKKRISQNTVWAVACDLEGNIYAGTNNGLNIFKPTSQTRKNNSNNYEYYLSLADTMVTSLYFDQKGNRWVGTQKGLFLYDQTRENYIHFKPQIISNNSNLFIWVIKSIGDNVYAGTNNGIWKANKRTLQLDEEFASDNFSTCWAIFPISTNQILAGTRSGLFHCNLQQNKVEEIPYSNETQNLHARTNIWCITKDTAGFYWAGTDIGLMKVRKEKTTFQTLTTKPTNGLSLSGPSIHSVLVDRDKTLWIGTDGAGINLLEADGEEFTVIKMVPGKTNSLTSNRIWALIEDSDGLVWVGTYGGGLNCINKKSGAITSYLESKDENKLSNNRIMALFEDSKGKIWIGTRGGGLCSFNKSTKTFTTYKHHKNDSTSLLSDIVLAINEDWDGNIWVGTYLGGLSKFDAESNSFLNFPFDENKPGGISNNNVWSILFDEKNTMWLGTQGGLNWANEKNGTLEFRHLTTKHGLPSNVIFSLEQDHNGSIWMSTFRGIAKLSERKKNWLKENFYELNTIETAPSDAIVTSYNKQDGIHGNEFNQGASFIDDNGNVYFGGLKGMTFFHPDSLKTSPFEPKVIFTDFKVFNNPVKINKTQEKKEHVLKSGRDYFLGEKITYLDRLILSYKESVFSFQFASLELTDPDQNLFAYKMDNFESEWNYVGNQNTATYTNLDAGDYTFRVKATNVDEAWSPNEAKIIITILPPFWKTTWFTILAIVFAFLIFIFIILRVLKFQKRKAKAEQEKIELQLKTIKNQIDPHFAFNAINMIGSLVYKNDPDTVYDYFSRFAQLIRSTLNDSEKISRTLRDELNFVKNYIEIQKTRFKNKFDFEINIGENTDENFEVPKMIIQTYVENSIKHGIMNKEGKGLVSIKIMQDSDCLKISVKDDGIGRKKAANFNKTSTKKGTTIIRQIFELYKKIYDYDIKQEILDLTDKNGRPAGTEVKLSITKNNRKK